jgi:hypothetical protein
MTPGHPEHSGAVATEPFEDLQDHSGAMAAGADGTVRLRGSRCLRCGTTAFPERQVCFACGSAALGERLLGPYGVLYSYTVVHVAPGRPTPYCIGYVDLDDGVRVLATVLGASEARGIDARGRLAAGPAGDWVFEVGDEASPEGERQ